MSAGEVEAQPGRSQTIERGAVQGLRGIAFTYQRARSGGGRVAPRGATCRRSRLEALESRPGRVRTLGAARSFDELDRSQRPERQIVGIFEHGLGRGERVVIARKPVVQ